MKSARYGSSKERKKYPPPAQEQTEQTSLPTNKSVSNTKHEKPLPKDFMPTPYTVVLGKGNVPKSLVGNRRLRVLASAVLHKYEGSKSRKEKTSVITELLETFRSACPTTPFVKYQNGEWWEVDDNVAREKIGYVFRDLLHDRYRSSSKSKGEIRRRKSQQEALKHHSASNNVDQVLAASHHIPSDRGMRGLPNWSGYSFDQQRVESRWAVTALHVDNEREAQLLRGFSTFEPGSLNKSGSEGPWYQNSFNKPGR